MSSPLIAKGKSVGSRGLATLEILIAMAVVIFAITAVLPLASGSQSISVASQTNQEALYKAHGLLEEARALSRSDFGSVETSDIDTDDFYSWQTIVDPASVTQCGKDVKGHTTWSVDNRPFDIGLTTHLSDMLTAVALGGNCDDNPPVDGWSPPDTWAKDNFNPGKPTTLDSFDGFVYMGGDHVPYFYIANTNGVAQGTDDGMFIDFTNDFEDKTQVNDIKVAKLAGGELYAFVARNVKKTQNPLTTITSAFEVIKVTDPFNPVSVAVRVLSGVDIMGSEPHGHRIFYYDNRVYVVTRETAGPELHIFDVSNPNDPSPLGSTELGITVNDFVITKKIIAGTPHYFAFMATSSDSKELMVLDVTNPGSVVEVSGASRNLIDPDYADGNAVFLVGNRLYFGRDSSSPSDLYIFDITSNPLAVSGGLPILAEADVGTSVTGIAVSGNFAFLATRQANKEFKVWKADPADFVSVCVSFNFPNIIENGVNYEDGWVYLSSQANDSLRILYDNAGSQGGCY